MKFLIVGLGNPGDKYKNTRHNIGYRVLDLLAESAGISFSDKRYALVSEMKHKGKTLILLKPTTYMNLSGKAVNYYLQAEKIPIENLMVVVDDFSLELGKIRIKAKGSSGGHNGLQSIQDILGTVNYNRLRFGIGNNFHQGGQVDYVLGEWTDDELKILHERIELAAEAVKSFPIIGIDRTMNYFNNK